jgi:microcystin-dependent protein
MPDTPTPDYGSLAATVTDLQTRLTALENQQTFVIVDPNGQTGDPQNNSAVAVLGNIGPYLGSATPVFGFAVWTPSDPTLGDWVQIGGLNGAAGLQAGDIKMTGLAAAPAGWLLLDGSTVTGGAALYPALAAACPWLVSGADLHLPDCRGRSAVGVDTGGVHMPVNLPAMGNSGGEETHLLVTAEAAQKAVNTATGTTGTGTTGTGSTGTGTTGTGTTGTGVANGTTALFDYYAGTGSFTPPAPGGFFATAGNYGTTDLTLTANVPGLSIPGLSVPGLSVPGLSVPGLSIPALAIAAASAASAHNTMHPWVAFNFMIKC